MGSCKAVKTQTRVIGKGGSQSSGSGPALQDSLNRIRSDQISDLETVQCSVNGILALLTSFKSLGLCHQLPFLEGKHDQSVVQVFTWRPGLD